MESHSDIFYPEPENIFDFYFSLNFDIIEAKTFFIKIKKDLVKAR